MSVCFAFCCCCCCCLFVFVGVIFVLLLLLLVFVVITRKSFHNKTEVFPIVSAQIDITDDFSKMIKARDAQSMTLCIHIIYRDGFAKADSLT